MKLLIDIGNSRIKTANYTDGALTDHAASLYTRNELAGQLGSMWQHTGTPEQIWIANVAGHDIAAQITAWCQSYWGLLPQFARVTETCAGVRNAYADVTRLGIDRWLALIGARTRYRDAVLIADCGTAVTLDVINRAGAHLGGLILPGTVLMRESLARTTAAIPATSQLTADAGLATNTDQAVTNGCHLAVAAVIERIWHDRQCDDENLSCLLTGGGAAVISELLTIAHITEPYLVLEGLATYAGLQA